VRRAARRVSLGRLAAVAFLLLAVTPASPQDGPTLEQCDLRVREAPEDPGSYYCFYLSVRALGRHEEAVERLEAILREHPGRHRAGLILGMIQVLFRDPRAEAVLLEALEGMWVDEDWFGVTYAGLERAFSLGVQGRSEEARQMLGRAREAADRAGNPHLLARVCLGEALQAEADGDYGLALDRLTEAERRVFPEGPANLQGDVLSHLGGLQWFLDDLRGAWRTYEREAELRKQLGDALGLAQVKGNLALLASSLAWMGELESARATALEEEALRSARRAGSPGLEISARLLLAQSASDPESALEHLVRALEISRRVAEVRDELRAMRLLASWIIENEPERAAEGFAMLDRTVERARALGLRFELASAILARAHQHLLRGSRERGIEAYLDALDEIESLRARQVEETVRMRTQARWDFPFYRLSGYLLRHLDESPFPSVDLELAFRTMERLRARTLLETLAVAGAVPRAGEGAPHEEREALLLRISEVQRRLMDAGLPAADRRKLLQELDGLEAEELSIRSRIARLDPVFARLHALEISSLDEVRARLAEDQALLAFQLWDERDIEFSGLDMGASWLLVATRGRAWPVPVPDLRAIDDQVMIFEGLLESRDGSEAGAAARLYRDLLAEALEALPPSVERLVVVPDGALHRLPFEVLRAEPGAEPVAARFELTRVPSASLWMRWRSPGRRLESARGVLALADPELPAGDGSAEARKADPWLAGLGVGPLPYARLEARALARGVGGESRTLEGAEASEHSLKSERLGDYGMLHLAAHAVVDERRPDRSAVLLVPGSEEEDGLLQMREIVELDLDGRVVLLSACRSASGALVEGEGVMGLARAFFQAGAHAVIGSLWPLRDDEAEALVRELARGLSRGERLAQALAGAQRARLDAGAPAAAWAGLVVLGDGDLTLSPVASGAAGLRPPWPAWILGALLLLGLLLLLRARARG
jgi:CHAT domain-containing protein